MNAPALDSSTEALVTENLATASTALATLRSTDVSGAGFKSYVDAVAGTKLAFKVEAVDLVAKCDGQEWIAHGIRRAESTGAFAKKPLGTFGNVRALVQNEDIARAFDEMLKPLGGIDLARVVRAQSFDGGRVCSMAFELPAALSALLRVRRDGSDRRALIVGKWSHDGSVAITTNAVVERVVCLNGMIVETKLIPTFKIKHTKQSAALAPKMKNWLAAVGNGLRDIGDVTRAMDAHRVDEAAVEGIVAEILAPDVAVADLSHAAKKKVESVVEMVMRRDGQFVPAGDVTLYTLLEAFTAFDMHTAPVRGDTPEVRAERRELRVITGDAVGPRAYEALRSRML